MEGLIVFMLIGVLIWYVSIALPRKKVRRLLDQLARGEGLSAMEAVYLHFAHTQQIRMQDIARGRRTINPTFALYDWSEINHKTVVRSDLATFDEMMYLPPRLVQNLVDSRHPSVASEIANIKLLITRSELGELTELATRTRQRLLEELDALRRTPSEALERFATEADQSISRTREVRDFFGTKPEETDSQEA
jgi:hypothetical protein